MFLNEFDQQENCARVAVIKLTYIYFKSDSIYASIKEKMRGQQMDNRTYLVDNSQNVIADLVKLI